MFPSVCRENIVRVNATRTDSFRLGEHEIRRKDDLFAIFQTDRNMGCLLSFSAVNTAANLSLNGCPRLVVFQDYLSGL